MHYLLFGASSAHGVGDYQGGGWGTMLRLFLDREKRDYHHTLTNLSISGNTTRNQLERYEEEAKRRIRNKPQSMFATIFALGTNDAWLDKADTSNNISEKEYEQNVIKLIALAQKLTSRVILVGPQPVIEAKTTPFKYELHYTNSKIQTYAAILKSIAAKEKVTFVDLLHIFANQSLDQVLADGLHPNTAGHHLIFEAVKASL